jgi:hypothetical protein
MEFWVCRLLQVKMSGILNQNPLSIA